MLTDEEFAEEVFKAIFRDVDYVSDISKDTNLIYSTHPFPGGCLMIKDDFPGYDEILDIIEKYGSGANEKMRKLRDKEESPPTEEERRHI